MVKAVWTFRTFIAVLLLSGYCKVPYRNLYWADAPDTHNEAAPCAMSRNRFREILSNLHLTENTQITEHRYYIVLFEKLNFNLEFVHLALFDKTVSMAPQ